MRLLISGRSAAAAFVIVSIVLTVGRAVPPDSWRVVSAAQAQSDPLLREANQIYMLVNQKKCMEALDRAKASRIVDAIRERFGESGRDGSGTLVYASLLGAARCRAVTPRSLRLGWH
jgi:hypothetical protein